MYLSGTPEANLLRGAVNDGLQDPSIAGRGFMARLPSRVGRVGAGLAGAGLGHGIQYLLNAGEQ